MKIEELLDKYIEKFGGFPIYAVPTISEEELSKILEKALETGEPYEPKYDEECDY